MEKKKLLFNDYVVLFDECNFRCDYCLNKLKPNQTDIWKMTEKKISFDADMDFGKHMEYSGDLEKIIDTTLNRFNEYADTPILRISGGEILAIKNIETFFEKYYTQYDVIQIVTNGFYLTPILIQKLNQLGNIHIHLSLDGHNVSLNYNRVKVQEIQDRLLDNLDTCIKSNLNVEISSVLTKQNTKYFTEFLDYLLKYKKRLIVLPAPVRGEGFNDFFPDKESIVGFHKVYEQYEKYKTILPPFAYIQELVDFMDCHNRTSACHVPKAAIQSMHTGSITPCPNGWTLQLGNILSDNASEIPELIGSCNVYDILLQGRPRLKYCKECFTAYDMVNLFFNEKISLEELVKVPLYASPAIYSRLLELKNGASIK